MFYRDIKLKIVVIMSLLFATSFSSVAAVDNENKVAVISIIIDDIGYRYREGKAAINLPGSLTYAILPHAPHTKMFAKLAHQQGKEVMLHMPMESEGAERKESSVLVMDMTHSKFIETFRQGIADVPHAVGVNNHQGSLLTRHPGDMAWVMAEVKQTNNWFFIDSRTTSKSVAMDIAREYDVPVLGRDVFLDHTRTVASIKKQYQYLLKLALQKGHAVAIAHPYPETIEVLEEMLPELSAQGVELVTISEQLNLINQINLSQLDHQMQAEKQH